MSDASFAVVDDALARAVVYRTLSVGFQSPIEERLGSVGAREGFPVVAAALRHVARGPGGSTLDRAALALASVTPAPADVLAAAFVRLFGHTARGLVCACECEYGPDNAFHQPQQLADIAGYYLAFGLRPAVAADARLDSIACELEFMDFLSRRQAFLLVDDEGEPAQESEAVEITRRAGRTFLRDHLARFGRAFATRVVAEDPAGHFGALGQTLLAFLSVECARVGVEAGPVDLAVRPEAADDTPMACGSAGELIQIQRRP